MPRLARTVFPGVTHHVTQRGNRRENVFFSDEDRRTYLAWLREYCAKHGVEILAYCLMTNHMHVVAVPSRDTALELEVLRRYVERGLPCGAEGFIRKLERMAGHALRFRARGRPKGKEGG